MYMPFCFGAEVSSEAIVGTVTLFLQEIDPPTRKEAEWAVKHRFPGIHPDDAETALSSYSYPV
jgi:hypothetical protein